MPYNISSTNPDTKFDAAVDKKLAEQDQAIAALLKRIAYVEKRVS